MTDPTEAALEKAREVIAAVTRRIYVPILSDDAADYLEQVFAVALLRAQADGLAWLSADLPNWLRERMEQLAKAANRLEKGEPT